MLAQLYDNSSQYWPILLTFFLIILWLFLCNIVNVQWQLVLKVILCSQHILLHIYFLKLTCESLCPMMKAAFFRACRTSGMFRACRIHKLDTIRVCH